MSRQKTYAPRRRNWLKPTIFGREVPLFWAPIFLCGWLLVTHYLVRTEIERWSDAFLDGFRWIGDIRYGAVDYDLGGRFEVASIVIEPDGNDPEATIHIDRIVAQAPGTWWLVRTQLPSFDFSGIARPKLRQRDVDRLPPTDRLAVRFEGIDWGAYGAEFVLPEIDWVGPYSGALFEAAGCERDWWWHADEFADKLRLGTPGGDIAVEFEVLSERELRARTTIGSENTSRTIIERRFLLDDARDFANSDPDDWRTIETRWQVVDQGFVAARNRYCAEAAGITEAEFVERHLASVERLLLAKGLRWNDGIRTAYRRYAAGGAELIWQTNYGKGIAYEDIAHRTDAAVFTVMNADLNIAGGPAVPYRLEVVTPKPFPEGDELESVYALVRLEQGLGPLPNASALADVSAKRPKSFKARAEEKGDAYVRPKPEAYGDNVIVSLPPDFDVPIADLPQYVGRLVQVDLINGSKHRGIVESDADDRVTVRIAVPGGSASIPLAHKHIRKVTRLD